MAKITIKSSDIDEIDGIDRIDGIDGKIIRRIELMND
jgi:hypothetical protein